MNLTRPQTQKDQLRNTTTYSYSSFGSIREEKDSYGNTIENKADLTGNVTSAKDKNGSITYITYDALSRPVKKKMPLEKDAAGSILYTIESYSYDALGNVTQKEITGTKDKLSSRTITYTYYDNNIVNTVTDSSGSYSKSCYDKNGNTVKTEHLRAENIYDIQKYEYDSMNRLTKDMKVAHLFFMTICAASDSGGMEIKMKSYKMFLCFWALISFFICALSSSQSFLFSYNIGYDQKLLNEIVMDVFNFKYMTLLNLIFASIFLLNSISIVLYIFNTDIRIETKKYFSFFSVVFLIIGLILFIFYVISFLEFYPINESFRYFSFKFILSMWIPKVLIFSLLTLYLISIQICMVNRAKSIKLNKKTIIISIYIVSIVFLTIITFFNFSVFIEETVCYIRVKICEIIPFDKAYEYRCDYYVCVIFLTMLFGAILGVSERFSKKKRKQQILKA